MAGQNTIEKLGPQDIEFHNPATGTVTQTFPRTSRLNSLNQINRNKFSAADVPLLDAPVVVGAWSPFEVLLDTQAAKQTDAALAEIRKNMPFAKNFETNGGQSGTGVSSAIKTSNTNCFIALLATMSAGDTMFFPGRAYEFKYVSGVGILNLALKANITLVGTGAGTVLRADPTDAAAKSFISAVDMTGIKILDMTVDYTGGGVMAIDISCVTLGITGLVVEGVTTIGGVAGIQLLAPAAFPGNRYTIRDCFLTSTSSAGLTVSGFGAGRIHSNTLSGATNRGIIIIGVAGGYIAQTEVVGNNLGDTEGYIEIIGDTGSSLQTGFVIQRNWISNGDIILTSVNEVSVENNRLYNGGIVYAPSFASAFNNRFSTNFITGGVFRASFSAQKHGIYVFGSACTLEGLEIEGGRIRSTTHHGIKIQMEAGVCRGGTIHDVFINNPNRTATNSSGIFLDDGAAKGVQYMNIHNNQIITDTVTVPDYGIKEHAGVTCKRNHFSNNITRGYAVNDILVSGAGSTEVNSFDETGALAW